MDNNGISLKDYFDEKINGLKTATSLAYVNMEKRLEGMNEFRQQLRDQTTTFVTKAEFNLVFKPILEDIKLLRESKANLEGKASQSSVMIAYIASSIGILFGIINLVLNLIGK